MKENKSTIKKGGGETTFGPISGRFIDNERDVDVDIKQLKIS